MKIEKLRLQLVLHKRLILNGLHKDLHLGLCLETYIIHKHKFPNHDRLLTTVATASAVATALTRYQ